MKNSGVSPFLFLIFILAAIMVLSGITVWGGWDIYLINDSGSSPDSWNHVTNKLASASSLGNGPSSGNPGSFYYFRTSGGSREMKDAIISRTVVLNSDQRTLCSLNQLQVNFSLDYFGWSDDEDRFVVSIYSVKANESWSTIYSSSSYVGDRSWRRMNMPTKALPYDTAKIYVVITAFRESGSDLDVYLDNIRLSLIDDNPPVMIKASVTGIRDYQGNSVPLKKDPVSGIYLDNWVSIGETIYGEIEFNEPVKIQGPRYTLNTNISNNGNCVYAEIESPEGSFSTTHQFSIPFKYNYWSKAANSIVKFEDSILPPPFGVGFFDFPVADLGGNNGPSDIMKPNIENYGVKLDSASPTIDTPWHEYEGYVPGRSTVRLIISEKDRGMEQAPLTLTYFWEYMNSSNIKIREENKTIAVNGTTAAKSMDSFGTVYTLTLDIPNGSNIPPHQEFRLYAEVNDAARSSYSNRAFFGRINQKDNTPPVITWENGGDTPEDAIYYTSRIISFSAEDQESGVQEVRYLWTREAGNIDKSSFKKILLPGGDGRYTISTTKEDTPLEGMYYLNVLAVNGSGESVTKRKGFYFDCEGPRVINSEIEYIEGKPVSAHYQVKDRALRGKFLYAFLTAIGDGSLKFEPIDDPDISGGIVDSGMWKALDLEGTGEERTADIAGVLDKVIQSGYYKLIVRYYDELWNCSTFEQPIWYDFEPPHINIVGSADLAEPFEPQIFKKAHSVMVSIFDESSGPSLLEEEMSVNWIDAVSGEVIPAEFEGFNQQMMGIKVYSDENLNGRYHLKIRVKDNAKNVLEEELFMDGNPVEFCFDNSPPELILIYDTESKAKTVMFAYSGLRDDYSSISLFRYGISDAPRSEPGAWMDADPASDSGEIIYPEAFITEGKWYLSILLQDALGNERVIRCPEVFDIDSTKPSGNISFERDYTNSLQVSLKLTVDELSGEGNKTFRAVLSEDSALLESISADAADWMEVIFENGIAYCNWTLDDTGDGEQEAFVRYMDGVGNLSEIYSDSIVLDRTAPTGEVSYDVTVPTLGNVTAVLSMADNYSAYLLNKKYALLDGETYKYTFNRNGEFEFIISDEAGNKTRVSAEVTNIDKEAPGAAVVYSHPRDQWTGESVTAQLQLEDDNGFIILSEGGNTHTFDENGEFIFLFRDDLGNEGSIKAEVKNIDKEAPIGSIIYSGSDTAPDTTPDTAPVTVYLSVNEPVEVTNNDGSFRHVFEENGSFTFEFMDKGGNAGTAIAAVDSITSPEKYADVIYSDSGRLTNRDINVEYTTFSDLSIITIPTVSEEAHIYTHEFTENGEFPVSVRVLSGDEEGNIKTVIGSVHNIDRVSPDAEVIFSREGQTNQNVTAALLTRDDRGKTVLIRNNNGSNIFEFEENGTFTFELADEAGNIGYKEVTVSNIDKTPPVGEIQYIKDTVKKTIEARISFPGEMGEVKILNNNGADTFEFVENGIFKFTYSDEAGNIGETTAQVTGFSGIAAGAEIEYYIDGIKVGDPNESPINKSVTAKLLPGITGGPYTIINNEGSDSFIFEKNGEFTFIYENEMGAGGFAKAAVSTIDKAAPKLQILADTVRPTQKDVTVTISYSDDKGIFDVIHNMEEGNLTASEGKLVYICKENKVIQITVIDTAGNETSREFVVDYIDRTVPVGTVGYTPGSITNKDVRAILTLDEPGRVLNNNGKKEYIFADNGEFTFEFEDAAGNWGSAAAAVNWIDKVPPKGSLEYSNTEMSNKPVLVTLTADPDAIIMNNGGMPVRTFYTNGYFTFRITDEAGNIVSLKAEVWNIDEEKPQIYLKGNTYECIMQGEPYVEAGYRASDNIDGDITGRVAVFGSVNSGEAGIYLLKYKVSDAVGNSAEEVRTVRVLEPGELVLLLNGRVAEGTMLLLDSNYVTADALGNEGSIVIKWGEGKRTQAWFKGNGNTVAGSGVWLEAGRWYTFFVQDRERRTKSIQIYINE